MEQNILHGLCVGIDAGGTKTELVLAASTGRPLGRAVVGGCDYTKLGAKGVEELLFDGARRLTAAHCLADVGFVCAGIPYIGEFPAWQGECEAILRRIFPFARLDVQNDVVVGMYGSLALEEGIHMVSGTGSIVFGRDALGNTARAGGWNEDFSDEGSCYWLGLLTLELFFKQADGRLPKGALYSVVRQAFALGEDTDLIEQYQRFRFDRSQVASLQRHLERAALLGDGQAINAYRRAGEELAMCVGAVYRALRLAGPVKASYSGGLFKAGDLVLLPLRQALAGMDITLRPPRLSPGAGALLRALTMAGLPRDAAIGAAQSIV